MKKTDRVYLSQMFGAVTQCIDYVKDESFESFAKSRLLQSAVIMQLIVIGELTTKLKTKSKELINLRWTDMAGLRNKAVHEYFYLELPIIWRTVKEDLPVVKRELGKYFRKKQKKKIKKDRGQVGE